MLASKIPNPSMVHSLCCYATRRVLWISEVFWAPFRTSGDIAAVASWFLRFQYSSWFTFFSVLKLWHFNR